MLFGSPSLRLSAAGQPSATAPAPPPAAETAAAHSAGASTAGRPQGIGAEQIEQLPPAADRRHIVALWL